LATDLRGYHVEQLFIIEVFAGGAVLTSVAKQFGLGGIAIDKVKKANARSTIFQLDLLQQSDRELLEQWLMSPLLLWVHFAPVCGTASRAREIPRRGVANLPRPLRSFEFPLGLPTLEMNSKGWRLQMPCFNTPVNYFLCVFEETYLRRLRTQEDPTFG
jgi:hypothetical protein